VVDVLERELGGEASRRDPAHEHSQIDAARRKYWRSYGGGPGLRFLLHEFVPRLREAGLVQDDIDGIFVRNPARCYCLHKL